MTANDQREPMVRLSLAELSPSPPESDR